MAIATSVWRADVVDGKFSRFLREGRWHALFFSRRQSNFKGKNKPECLVQRWFLTNTPKTQEIMTKAGSNHSVTAALPAPSQPRVNYMHSLYEITTASYKWCMKIKWENSNQGMNPRPHGWAGLGEGGRGADKATAGRKPRMTGNQNNLPSTSLSNPKLCFRRCLKQH